jgi:hypothetical protein
LSGEVRAGGTLTAPKVNGTLEPQSIALTVTGLAQPLHDIDGRVAFNDRRVTIDNLIAHDRDGSIKVNGTIDLAEDGEINAKIAVRADEFPIRQQGQIAGEIDAKINVGVRMTDTRTRVDVTLSNGGLIKLGALRDSAALEYRKADPADLTPRVEVPDGQIDPKGTVYRNEARVDIWPGETSGIIGVTQDWEFSELLTKQGSVLGGADRNGQIRWTVTVAGDHLVNKDDFTLTEALTGEHALCSDTISGIRIYERYGPSTAQQREITGELTSTTISSSSGAFEVQFAIKDDSDFEFQPSDYLYLIQYDTCATTDGLPESGTTLTLKRGCPRSIVPACSIAKLPLLPRSEPVTRSIAT